MSQGAEVFRPDGWSEDGLTVPITTMPLPEPIVASAARPRRATWRQRLASGEMGLLQRLSQYGAVGDRQLGIFCRQFSAYLEAGVNLLDALESLQRQFAWTRLGAVLERVIRSIRGGESLADALGREPSAFDRLFRNMIAVAEVRGGVPETLRALSDHYQSRHRLIRQARSALVYPAVVISIAFAVVLLLSIYVLPVLMATVRDLAESKNIELPTSAALMMGFSDFVQRRGWWLLPAVFFGSMLAIWLISRTRRGKAVLDEVLLMIPVLGPMARRIDLTRLSRTLSALLGAGIDIGTSLELTAAVLNLSPLRRALRRAREAVLEGLPLSESLEATRRFPGELVSVVATGEETGRLPEILIPLADDYDQQIEHGIRDLSNLFQPLITVLLGGLVFFVLLSFLSVYSSILVNLGGAR